VSVTDQPAPDPCFALGELQTLGKAGHDVRQSLPGLEVPCRSEEGLAIPESWGAASTIDS
jgi:hypothetical protein